MHEPEESGETTEGQCEFFMGSCFSHKSRGVYMWYRFLPNLYSNTQNTKFFFLFGELSWLRNRGTVFLWVGFGLMGGRKKVHCVYSYRLGLCCVVV